MALLLKNQEEINNNKKRIIFPYKQIGKKFVAMNEYELKNKFPECYLYLIEVKDELATRDKGKRKYEEWFAYARTQGLNFYGRKLMTPTFSSYPRFLFENNEDSLFCNGYSLYAKIEDKLFEEQIDFKVLQKILNSKIMDYYTKKTSVSLDGGYPCYQKNFIELFSIPQISKEENQYLLKETDKNKINNFLIKKYGLNLKLIG